MDICIFLLRFVDLNLQCPELRAINPSNKSSLFHGVKSRDDIGQSLRQLYCKTDIDYMCPFISFQLPLECLDRVPCLASLWGVVGILGDLDWKNCTIHSLLPHIKGEMGTFWNDMKPREYPANPSSIRKEYNKSKRIGF